MPSCCVRKCTNSSKKKYSMHRIPTDRKKRNCWIKNIGRSDLDPAKAYCVCETHFAPEMWEEVRVDGKEKLKSSAVPTLFMHQKSTNTAEVASFTSTNTGINTTTLNRVDDEKFASVNLVEQDMEEIESTSSNIAELARSVLNEEEETVTPIVSTSIANENISVPLNIVEMKKIVEEAERKTQKALLEAEQAKSKERHTILKLLQANKIITKLDKSKKLLMKRVKRLTYEKTKLIEKMCHQKQTKNVGKILNDDQIEAICTPSKRCGRWSNETLKKALKLKLSCGSSGYKEILNQGMPLPSERTLRRRLEGIDFEPGICEQIFDVLRERVSHFSDDREKDCMLTLDEMSITSGQQIDQSTMSYIGILTLPDRRGKL